MMHRRRTSEWVVKMTTPHKPHSVFLHVQLFHSNIVQVKTLAFCLQPSAFQVSPLCFAHRHSWGLLVPCYRLAYCDGSTRKSLRVHATLRGFCGDRDMHLSQVMSPSPNSMTRRNLLTRSGQATPIPLDLSRRMMSSSLQVRPSVLSDQF